MPLVISLLVAVSLLSPSATIYAAPKAKSAPQSANLPQAQTVQQYVSSYFADQPVMVAVAECESHFHQYSSNGDVYRGTIDNQDVGVMQINEHYQGATAQALGFDLHTLQGNVAYARYLYNKEGTQPWTSSSPCWDKSQAAKDLVATTQK